MIRKIYLTIVLIIFFVSLFILGNQILLHQFRISSDKLLLEYNELYALQDFRTSLIHFQNHILEIGSIEQNQNHVDSLYLNIQEKKRNCERLVTQEHLDEDWHSLLVYYNEIISLFHNNKTEVIPSNIDPPMDEILLFLNGMINETNDEIEETVKRNTTIQKHGSVTILFIGFLFILLIFLISNSTARSITTPIREFLETFKKLEAGEKDKRVNIIRDDEFGKLATEFNDLFDQLNNTTVTLAYVRNIIDSIFGALFVTDIEGKIQSCNLAAKNLLGYDENELIGKHITIFFNSNPKSNNGHDAIDKPLSTSLLIQNIKNSTEIYSADGKTIPVMNTCTELKNDHETGLIVVAHDISDKKEFEKQLEKIKREHLVKYNEAQEIERTRIASDLHDGIGQKLSAISYSIQNLNDSDLIKDRITKLQILVDEAISETRTISHSIMPSELKDFGLIPALNDLVEEYNKIQSIQFVFNQFGFKDRIDARLEKAIFRICQEALNNIIKHSKAQNATFQIFKSENLITLTIEDDGIGITEKSKPVNDKGIGLLSIKERVYSFNGNFTLNSIENNGTEIIIEIPYS